MKAITNIFASQPAGNVPASYLDVDFALIADAGTFSNYFVDTGAANAYVVTFAVGETGSLLAGLPIQFLAAAENTGASTLAVNGLPAKNITNWDGSALSAGQIKVGTVVSVIYDGTQYKLAGLSAGATIPLASGSITTSQPALPITQTWNNAGVTFDASTITITDTASNAASRFVNYLVGASSKFSVDKAGNVVAAGNATFLGSLTAGAISGTTGAFSTSLSSGTGTTTTAGLKIILGSAGAGSGYGAIYAENLTPSGSNYAFFAKADGNVTALNAAVNTQLKVANATIANVASTGLAVTGTLSVSGISTFTLAVNCGTLGVGTPATTTSMITMLSSTTAYSSINIPHGVAPTSPVNGDVWTTTAGLFIRINGVTKTVTLT